MNDGLEGCNAGDPSMEVVVSSEIPSRQPHEQVISHAKQPNHREVGKGDDARSIRDVSDNLQLDGVEAE